MEHLASADLTRILDGVRRIETVSGLDSFRATAMRVLDELVPNDAAAYNEIEHGTGRVHFVPSPPEIGPLLAEPWLLHMDQHPVLAHAVGARDSRAFKISDFLSRSDFHMLDLYDTCFRPLSLEHQMSIGPLLGPPLTVGIAINRGRRDFSERDRAVANLLVPHLRAGYENARARELAAAIAEWEDASTGLLILNAAGSVLVISPAARRLLASYFPEASRGGIPEPLRSWIRSQEERVREQDSPTPNVPLAVDGEGGRLLIRYLPGPTPESPCRILIEERRSPVRPDVLLARGLTRRQVQVLGMAARGYADKQIAAELSISVRTVRKHFENLYERLGVRGRTAALAKAAELQDAQSER